MLKQIIDKVKSTTKKGITLRLGLILIGQALVYLLLFGVHLFRTSNWFAASDFSSTHSYFYYAGEWHAESTWIFWIFLSFSILAVVAAVTGLILCTLTYRKHRLSLDRVGATLFTTSGVLVFLTVQLAMLPALLR